jgi:hypothetical protein
VLETPIKHGELFARAPLRLCCSVLLYGPPGCGKTHIEVVTTVACSLNFVSVKGPELLNKYNGAFEQGVRFLVLLEVHAVVHDTCSFFLCLPHFSKCSLGQSMGCNVFLQSARFVGCDTPMTRAARQDAFVWFSLYVWTMSDSPSALTEGRIFPSLQLLLDLMRTCRRISISCLVWRQSRDGFTGLWEIASKSQGPVLKEEHTISVSVPTLIIQML